MSIERVKNLIANMVLNYNYWGFLFSRVRIVERKNLPFPMHVECDKNGTISLVFLSNLFDIVEENEVVKLLEHEGYHLLNQHLVRLVRFISVETNIQKKAVKMKCWNYATDFVVNQMANFYHITIAGHQYDVLRPEKYNLPRDRSAEWYYYQLMKQDSNELNQQKKETNQQDKDKSKQKNSKEKQKPQPNTSQKDSDQSKKNKNNKQKSQSGTSSSSSPQDSNQSKNMTSSNSQVSEDVTNHDHWLDQLQTEDITLVQKVRRNIQQIVRESYKSFKKGRGTLPSSVEQLIQELLLPPKLPYYQIIRKLVKGSRLSKYKHSSEVINRKLVYTYHLPDSLPIICPFPGYKLDYSFVICIVIDVSGSMKIEEIKEALSGIKDIIENDQHCKTIVLEVDTIIHKEYVCKKTSDIQFKIKGRGGTTLGPALFRAKELQCDICLVFTDGYCEDMSMYRRKDLPRKVVWVLTEKGTDKRIRTIGPVVRLPN